MIEIASLLDQHPTKIMEVVASLLSCVGAHLVSRHGHSGRALWGWQLWLVAGVLWITFAAVNQFWFMAITQTYFFITAAQGRRNTIVHMKSAIKDPA